MRKRWLPAVGVGLAGVVVLVTGVNPVASAAVGTGGGGFFAPVPAGARAVTLITGDRVLVSGSGADLRVLTAQAAPGRAVTFMIRSSGEHRYVVPTDAVRPLRTGRLDERLFDVAELVAQGYDDASTQELHLMMRGGTASLRAERTLASVGLKSVSTPKKDAAKVWQQIRGGANAATLAGGVEKIWLDGRVRATLDQSVAQVGAPAAWSAGFTGAGVPVAVLDTGYDNQHPDLKGLVSASADFSYDESGVQDGNGHGTHVASTIAGSGSASGGRYKGVAPGARLLVGKVLGNDGYGLESSIVAGMEWAVASGAKVVNMSLGGRPSDGTDPMSLALDELSRNSGTLFVVAAGNYGGVGTVTSPSTADSALSVGSVDKKDKRSDFSSQGPRPGNFGLKPELVAPGGGIVAARSAGTLAEDAVGQYYAQLSGTSMASPHVAGAAAIVAGQHPDWTGEQIKAALVGSAEVLPDLGVFQQGAGRLNVARAVGQKVSAQTGSLDFGVLAWPHTGESRTGKVSYRNDSDQPVTLNLNLAATRGSSTAVPAGLLRLEPSTLTVPAHGSASATLAVTPSAQRIGDISGRITATATGVTLTTPLAVRVEDQTFDVTVRTVNRAGGAGTFEVATQNEGTGAIDGGWAWEEAVTLRLPAGKYRFAGTILDVAPESSVTAATVFARPVTVTGDTEVTVDARAGKAAPVRFDEPLARQTNVVFGIDSIVEGADQTSQALVYTGGETSAPADYYAIGSPRMPGLRTFYGANWTRPDVLVSATGPGGFELNQVWDNTGLLGSRDVPPLRGTVEGDLIDIGEGRPEEITDAVAGKIALLGYSEDFLDYAETARLLKAKGAKLLLAEPYVEELAEVHVIQVWNQDQTARLRAMLAEGPVRMRVDGYEPSPFAYNVFREVKDRVPAGWDLTFRKSQLGQRTDSYKSIRPWAETRAGYWQTFTFGTISGSFIQYLRLPQDQVTYYSPGVTWQRQLAGAFSETLWVELGIEIELPFQVRAGERTSATWFGAPFGPDLGTSFTGRPSAVRDGNRLDFSFPMFGDNDPAHYGYPQANTSGTMVLYRNGSEVARNDTPGRLLVDVPAGDASYRLVAEASCVDDFWPLSTKVSSEWTWRGGKTVLPLLDIEYGIKLDQHNAARAGATVTGKVTAGRQPVRTVEVSYDDGASWIRGTVRPDGSVSIPGGGKAGGFASLRVTAADTNGGTASETIIRAYHLK